MSDASRIHLVPVRHHSPRATAVVDAVLTRVQPDVVLVEGPADAAALIEPLTDDETVPPVAVLAYRTDGVVGSSCWPFAHYSPEYAALRWARRHGKVAQFIDITAAQALALKAPERGGDPVGDEPASDASQSSSYDRIAIGAGLRSFEEFWEANFEAPHYDEASFRAALLSFADFVRMDDHRDSVYRARDAVMLRAIERTLAQGHDPDRVVAVLGAAHAAALAVGDVDAALVERVSATVPVATTLIPYSFPRLAEQTGYGAGNRAPFFYQRAHLAMGDYRRATLEVLVDFTDHLRLRGFSASLADTIEAYRLACRLAELRGKSGPGLDEVREATIATLCRGESAYIDSFLWPTVVGKGVGRVGKGIGKNSLQQEFWHSVARYKLAQSDEAEAVSLRLADPIHVEISVFLHRLRMLQVPYAALVGNKRSAPAAAIETLSRVREAWQCQWTPATEVALVEAIVLGDSLAAATERALGQRLAEVKRVGDAAAVLVDAVATHALAAVSQALSACERLAAHDDDLPSLAHACRALAGLVAYGSSRDRLGADDGALRPLLINLFARATVRLGGAATASDEDAPAINDALRTLQELSVTQPHLDQPAWLAAMSQVAESFVVHPSCAGTAAGLLVLARLWSDAELDQALRLRLSATSETKRSAEFLTGFLQVNALAIVKNPLVVPILDTYLQSLPPEAFRDVVPMLRRMFAELGKTERRYLVEQVVSLATARSAADGLPLDARDAARVLTAHDEAQVRSMNDELQQAMDDLDDLL